MSTGLGFFNNRELSIQELKQYNEIGLNQLSALKEQLRQKTVEQEHQECETYLKWAKKHPHIRNVSTKIHSAPWFPKDYTFEIIDFSPKGFRGDDYVYSKNKDVWQKVPRGLAMFRWTQLSTGKIQSCWGIVSNRKFTGHEDESNSDAKLYCLSGPSAHTTIITLKENGSVLHFSARKLKFSGTDQEQKYLFLGSKKVHICLPWLGSVKKLIEDAQITYPANETRFALVHDMVAAISRFISEELVDFLVEHHLVINSEFLCPVSSGPINNSLLHDLKNNTSYVFSLTVNDLQTPAGLELCLNPIFTLDFLKRKFQLQTVQFFVISQKNLEQVKNQITDLTDVEGAVLYHLNDNGVIELEKVKSRGYVLVRAFREKSRNFILTRKHIGLEETIEKVLNSLECGFFKLYSEKSTESLLLYVTNEMQTFYQKHKELQQQRHGKEIVDKFYDNAIINLKCIQQKEAKEQESKHPKSQPNEGKQQLQNKNENKKTFLEKKNGGVENNKQSQMSILVNADKDLRELYPHLLSLSDLDVVMHKLSLPKEFVIRIDKDLWGFAESPTITTISSISLPSIPFLSTLLLPPILSSSSSFSSSRSSTTTTSTPSTITKILFIWYQHQHQKALHLLAVAQQQVIRRILEIDHVSLTKQQQQEWQQCGFYFFYWIFLQFWNDASLNSALFFNEYSENWTKFLKWMSSTNLKRIKLEPFINNGIVQFENEDE